MIINKRLLKILFCVQTVVSLMFPSFSMSETSRFDIRVDGNIIAGQPVNCVIKAAINDLQDQIFTLYVDPTAPFSPQRIISEQFINGVALIRLTLFRAGNSRIFIKNDKGVLLGSSDVIEVLPAETDKFQIGVPARARAGKPFTLDITVFDRYDNIVTDFNKKSTGITIKTSSGSPFFPNFIPSKWFVQGKITLPVSSHEAGDIEMVVLDLSTARSSKSGRFYVVRGELDHFQVRFPEQARVNEDISVEIIAKDAYDNIISDTIDAGFYIKFKGSSPSSVEKTVLHEGMSRMVIRLEQAKKPVVNNPREEPPHVQYIYYLIKQGQISRAIREAGRYLEKNPENDKIIKLKKRLEKIF